MILACANVQRVTHIHPRTPVNNENGICSWYAYILNDINDINNGYIGGACPYKNNGFGGGDGHAPHICRCENQLVVAWQNLKYSGENILVANLDIQDLT